MTKRSLLFRTFLIGLALLLLPILTLSCHTIAQNYSVDIDTQLLAGKTQAPAAYAKAIIYLFPPPWTTRMPEAFLVKANKQGRLKI